MALVIEESWLPATITHPPMSDEEFAEFCSEHSDLSFEMTADGEILILPPAYTLKGVRCSEISFQLGLWNRRGRTGVCGEATGGFVLPSGACRSPDAALTLGSRLKGIPRRQLERFWHVCPNFVIELKSDHDRLRTVRAKMREWIDNGAELGWLIDPDRRAVEVFRADGSSEVFVDAEQIVGEGPVDGFVLDLKSVWEPPSMVEHVVGVGQTD